MQPLVVTLTLDDATQQRFDAERRRFFPAGRTEVGAHLTLFHALPGEREADVRGELLAAAGARFPVAVTGLMPLGRGVAYRLEADELLTRHRALQRRWRDELTRQDAQPLRPHVTVQNKVTPAEARRTLELLRRGFVPFDAEARGYDFWRYDGGPWQPLLHVPFVP